MSNFDSSIIGPFNYQVIGHTVFAAGRFLCAFLDAFIKPRYVLLALLVGMIVTSALAMSLTERAGVAMIILCQFFESGIFPLIFAISLRGLGSFTKLGSVYLTAAISGGTILPVIMYPVINAYGLQYAFCTIVAASAFGISFPMYLFVVPAAKQQVDPVHERRTPILSVDRAASGVVERRRRKNKGEEEAEHVEAKEGSPG